MEIGKPNYKGGSAGGNSVIPDKVVFYRLGHKAQDGKDRVGVWRFAPPIKSLAAKGIWRRFMKQHFGYGFTVTTGNGDRRFIPATFLCIEETDRDGNITKQCPECNEIRAQKAKKEATEAELKRLNKTEEEIDTALKHKKSWLREHNIDKKWWALGKDLTGKWGVVTISYSSMKLFLELLKKLTETRGLDPLGVEKGCWFRFTRTGNSFNDIKDIPELEMERQNDDSYRTKYDTLTEGDIAQLEALPELTEFGRVLTYDQIDQLVKSGGDEAVVRAVMNIPQPNTRAPDAGGAKPPTVPAPVEPTVALKAPAEDAEAAEMAKLQAQLAALQAKKSTPKAEAKVETKVAAKAADVPPAKLQSQLDMPMDEFLAQFEK